MRITEMPPRVNFLPGNGICTEIVGRIRVYPAASFYS